MLLWKLNGYSRNLSIRALSHFLRESRDIVEVSYEGLGYFACVLWGSEFKDRIIVEGPILSLLIFTPDLFTLDAEDLDANASRECYVVGHQFGQERRITHDAVIGSGLLEHSLLQMRWKVVVDNEFAGNTLRSTVSDGGITRLQNKLTP